MQPFLRRAMHAAIEIESPSLRVRVTNALPAQLRDQDGPTRRRISSALRMLRSTKSFRRQT
jgi:hypothetical protein